jgi:D-glycero-beta-D-manno-heptose 1-phosphate adenylyltransferase
MVHLATHQEAVELRESLRAGGRTVVFTNGLFDVLHVGHLDYLERARALGDALIVGVNSDSSARALKGPAHPLLPEHERARLLAALRVVDAVIIFEELTACAMLRRLQPDIYVKGGDYATKSWPERATALDLGCRVELLPYVAGRSTSELIREILVRFCHEPRA